MYQQLRDVHPGQPIEGQAEHGDSRLGSKERVAGAEHEEVEKV